MRAFSVVVGLVLAMGTSSSALAWGEAGHELIGLIAETILNQPGHANAKKQMDAILNQLGHHSLAEASTWADCVRDVNKTAAGEFKLKYDPTPKQRTPKICKQAFPEDNDAETKAMTSYVANNWSQCDYVKSKDPNKHNGECHKTYHFDDIPFQHERYAEGDISTSNHDIVSVIGAAVYYLKKGQNKPGTAAKFSDSREALFVLAHLVGDIHQPLHVGSVYLESDGKIVVPGNEDEADKTFTKGGNDITDAVATSQNLHAEWDDIPANFDKPSLATLVADAQQNTSAEHGGYETWPAAWASETVKLAKEEAFNGLTFESAGKGKWKAQADTGYGANRRKIQKQQIERGGVRLARLLSAIWPD